MNDPTVHIPVIVICTSLIGAFLAPVLGKYRPALVGLMARLIAPVNALLLVILLRYVDAGETFHYYMGGWAPPWGIALSVDYLAIYVALIIHLVSAVILLYAKDDLFGEVRGDLHRWYYTLFLLLVAAMTALAFSHDFFNIFVFTEIATIAACALIAIKPKKECIEASFKYLILSTVGSGFILLALALIYMVTGHFNLTLVAQNMGAAAEAYPLNIMVSLALLIVGFGVKSALFPLHVWLPDAHSSAPSPSSAVLSGLVVKIYAVVLIRIILTVFGGEVLAAAPIADMILIIASVAIIAGSLFALAQTDIKLLLAFSTVAQVGYIYMGISLLSETGTMGGLVHIFNHALMKTLLFLAAGAIIHQTGLRKISDLDGIAKRMPITMAVFSVGALSMVGIPGFNGFISKMYLATGAFDAGKPVFILVILMSSLLNGLYYLPIVVRAFLGTNAEEGKFAKDELPLSMTFPLVILGLACIYFGLLPGSLLELVRKAAHYLIAV